MLHVAYYVLVLTFSSSTSIIALIADAHSRVVCLCVCFFFSGLCLVLPCRCLLCCHGNDGLPACLPTISVWLRHVSRAVAAAGDDDVVHRLTSSLPAYLPACLTDSLLTTNSHKWWTCWTRLLWPRNGNVIPPRTSSWYFASFLSNFTPMYALQFSFPLLLNASVVSFFLFTLIRVMFILNSPIWKCSSKHWS